MCAWLALCAACHTVPRESVRIDLPSAKKGVRLPTGTHVLLQLTKDGRIFFGDTPVSLDQLDARLDKAVADYARAQRAAGRAAQEDGIRIGTYIFQRRVKLWTLPVVLRVDRAAPYLHVVWLNNTLIRHDLARVFIEIRPDHGGQMALPFSAETRFYQQEGFDAWAKSAGASAYPPEIRVELGAGARGSSKRFRWDGHDSAGLATYVRSERRRLLFEKVPADIRPLGIIAANRTTPFAAVVAVMDAFAGVGVTDVLWGDEPAPKSVGAMDRLPLPEVSYRVLHADDSRLDVAPMTLPVGAHAETRHDSGYVILNLDRRGALLYRGTPRSLDEIATILSGAKQVYHLRQKAKGNSGYEDVPGGGEQRTMLALHLRADRDAPWQRILWLLTVVGEERFHKLRFAATREPPERYVLPPPPYWVSGALSFQFPPSPGPTGQVVPVRVRALAGQVVYSTDGHPDTTSAARLGSWIRAHVGMVAEIDADPTVPYKHVVAMLDELKRLGIRQLRFIPKQRLTNRLRRTIRQPCGAEEPDLVIDLEEEIEDDD